MDIAAGQAWVTDDWAAVHLSVVPGGVESDDGGRLVTILPTPAKWSPDFATLDSLYHPGTTVSQESIVVAAATGRVREMGGSLTEPEVRAVLTEAGWPGELHDWALRVSFCESKWSPYAHGDGGASLGLFQLNVATWFRYAGEDPEQWADPLVNARTAWATYNYDLGRGYAPWKQWSCKP